MYATLLPIMQHKEPSEDQLLTYITIDFFYIQVGSMIKQSAFRNDLARYFIEQKRVVWCP